LRLEADKGLWLLLAAYWFPLGSAQVRQRGIEALSHTSPGVSWSLIEGSAPIILAAGYGAAVLGIIAAGGWKLFAWAAPLGRMAFTNYLLQSFIFSWIFYGYGLGLFGVVGIAAALALGVAVYTFQVLLSVWWLRRFRFGPVEWLWRSLMYGTVQPMRAARAALYA
jgi:uncharacterized protein